MQYLLLIHDAEKQFERMSEEEMRDLIGDYGAFTAAIKESGAFVGANRLRPVATASTVRIRDGEEVVTDGPFAETKEQLGGYYLIDTETLDEALEWAAKIPSARYGSIEVRPLFAPATTGPEGPADATQYILLFYQDEQVWAGRSEDERKPIIDAYMSLAEELRQRGDYVAGAPLKPVATATTVRVRDDEPVVTDGPFAETKEQLGGFFLIGAASSAAACEWAAKIPAARYGSVEVRPIWPVPAEVPA
jgi:hypothetical protein